MRTIRQLARFRVMYLFDTVSARNHTTTPAWQDYFGRSFTFMEAGEKAEQLTGQFPGYRFKVLHEKLVKNAA